MEILKLKEKIKKLTEKANILKEESNELEEQLVINRIKTNEIVEEFNEIMNEMNGI